MNWLQPLTDSILAERRMPGEQRRTLVLWATELSEICDRHVPRAPAPMLLLPGHLMQLVWTLNDRFFAVSVTPDSRAILAMNDPNGTHLQDDPSYTELRTHVRSLFEGWKP